MHRDRALAVALIALIGVLGMVFLHQRGPAGMPWFPGCLFHRLTGLDCPGCGMTRATHAALHGRLMEAFRFNPLGMILLPVLLAWLAAMLPAWLRGRPIRPSGPVLSRMVRWGLGLILVFWFVRNLPFWPFPLLSPP